jgi:hypothetical protein
MINMTFCTDVDPNEQFFQADMLVRDSEDWCFVQGLQVRPKDCRLDPKFTPSYNTQQDHSNRATAITFPISAYSSIRKHGTNFEHTSAPSTDYILECSELICKRCQLYFYLLNCPTVIRHHKCATLDNTIIL